MVSVTGARWEVDSSVARHRRMAADVLMAMITAHGTRCVESNHACLPALCRAAIGHFRKCVGAFEFNAQKSTQLASESSTIKQQQRAMAPAVKRGRGGGAGGLEYISLDGLRVDGRLPNEVRKIRCALGALSRADGSAYYEQGNTRVLAAVYGPREPTGRDFEPDKAIVKCEFSTAMFASSARRRTWKGDRKSTAAALLLQRLFEGVILLTEYARCEIDIYVQVLQNDGGSVVAAVNAACLALINAGVAMSDFVVACSVGYVQNTFVADPNGLESAADRPELIVAVTPHSGKICSCQLVSKLADNTSFDSAMQYARAGAKQIFEVLEYEVKKYSVGLLDSRGMVAL